MIKATTTNGKILILILERGNITNMVDKKRPMTIKASHMGRKNFNGIEEIAIAFYETQELAIKAMAPMLQENTQFVVQEQEE
jgi:hypothetical protein